MVPGESPTGREQAHRRGNADGGAPRGAPADTRALPALEPSAIIDVMGTWASGRHGPALIFAFVAAASTPCHGQLAGVLDHVRAGPSRESRLLAERRVSLDQAVVIAQRHTGGRVLDARPQGESYRVKVLTRGGEVVVVFVDAKTGDVH